MSKRTRTRRAIRWSFRLLNGAAVAVIYFLIFSFFFDTPIEYEIKRSNRALDQQYKQMAERYDTLQRVLNNVRERDRGVYRILFEADPDTLQSHDHQARVDYLHELDSKSNRELGELLSRRLSALTQRTAVYQGKQRQLAAQAIERPSAALAIPAIQPVDNDQLTLLTASYGELIHPFFKTKKQHNGVDYSVATGTAVFATADGVVAQMQTRGQTSGLSMMIDHGNGYQTVYAHLDKAVVPPGRRVNRGDIIAFTGNSGLSFAPHLHYEVRYRGRPVDPTDYFFVELGMPRLGRLKQISQMGMQSFD